MASAGSYRTPPKFSENKPYSRWVDEIKVWQTVTELEPKKQGPAIALSLPEDSTVRDKVFSELGVDILNSDDGVKQLLLYLDKIYKQDELSTAYEAYTSFDRFKKTSTMSMENYLIDFDKLYNRTRKYTMTLPEAVLAFKLLEGANLSHKDRQLVLTGVNYSDVNHLYKQMCQSLKKFFGKQSLPESDISSVDIKIEPTFMTQDNEEAYYSRGSGNYRGRGNFYRRGNNSNRSRGNNRNSDNSYKRSTNPYGEDGKPLKCKICESIFHFARYCPDSYENLEKTEQACLFTGNKADSQVLLSESLNAAVLDSACSSTVTGEKWISCYLESLSVEKRNEVQRQKSNTVFRFGGGRRLKSKGKITIPCEIVGVKCSITTDIVESDIPLLLGKPAMKKAKIILDLENDRASIFGKDVDLQCTTSGHYCVPLEDTDIISVYMPILFNMLDKPIDEQRHVLIKLHKQFAHPTVRRLILLLKDAGIQDKMCEQLVDEITKACDICKLHNKSFPKVYQTGDLVYYKKDDKWNGPGKVLDQDGKIVLVRYGNVYVRVHSCGLIQANPTLQSNNSCNDSKYSAPQSIPIDSDTSSTPVFDFRFDIAEDSMPPEKCRNGMPHTNTEKESDHNELGDNGNDANIQATKELPKVKDVVDYIPAGENEWIRAEIVSKVNGLNKAWFNIKDQNSTILKAINFVTGVGKWKQIDLIDAETNTTADANVILSTTFKHNGHEIMEAENKETDNWSKVSVFEGVTDYVQPYMTSSFEWQCHTFDIKTAFLQGNDIVRKTYLKPP